MNFFKSGQPEPPLPLPKSPHHILRHALIDLHNHNHNQHVLLFNVPLFNLNHPCSFKTHLASTLSNLHSYAKQAIETGGGFLSFRLGGRSTWAPVSGGGGGGLLSMSMSTSTSMSMSTEAIEERLAGVPVYALSNSSEEFVLVSGVNNTGKSLGLFCFKEDHAEALLQQMKTMDPRMRQGSKVVAVALNKVFQLQLDGVAFRLIPEPSQIKNALRERRKVGFSDESFSGVPVFQSRSLILRSQNKRYRPVFFRKEDLENSLLRASRQQKQLNPAFREGDIQVAVLEDIIQGMKDSNMTSWDDAVFIPPGFDVSTDPSQK